MTATTAPTNFPCGLPSDIWRVVAGNLSVSAAVNLGNTCKVMNTFIQKNCTVWEYMYENRFGEGSAHSLKGRILTLQMDLLIDDNLKEGCFYPLWSDAIDHKVSWMKVGYCPCDSLLNLMYHTDTKSLGNSIGWQDLPIHYINSHFSKLRNEDPLNETFNIAECTDKYFNAPQGVNCMISTTRKAIEWEQSSDFKIEDVPTTFLMGLNDGYIIIDVESPSLERAGIRKTFTRIQVQPTGNITCLAFENGHFYSAANDKSLKKLTITAYSKGKQLNYHHTSSDLKCDTPFEIKALAAKNGRLYAGGNSNYLHIWDTGTQAHLDAVDLNDEGANRELVTDALYANENKLFVGYTDKNFSMHIIKVWNLDPFSYLNKIDYPKLNQRVTSLITYGPKLFSGHFCGSIRVWDIPSLKHIAVLSEPEEDTEVISVDIKDGVLCVHHEYHEEEKSLIQVWPLGLSRSQFMKSYKVAHRQMPPYFQRQIENDLNPPNKKQKK